MKTLFTLSILVFLSTSTLCQSETDFDIIDTFTKKFSNHLLTLDAYSKAAEHETLDNLSARALASIAREHFKLCDNIRFELLLPRLIENPPDKHKLEKAIYDRIRFHSNGFETALEVTTIAITSPASHDILVEGNKLKDDLRDLRDKLREMADDLLGK
jgi:hypothetical protein